MNPMYDLEQPMLNAFTIVDDLRLLTKSNATPEQYEALATVYDVKFAHLWDLFETIMPKVQAKNDNARS